MATISDLVAKLKLRAHIKPEERLSPTADLDTFLGELIGDAVTQHNPSYSIAILPPAEEMLVVLLAQIEVCYVRAEKTVNDAPVAPGGGAVGVQQADSPFKKNMALAERLAKRYDELVASMGLDSGASTIIAQSSVYKKSDRLDILFPFFPVPAAPPSLLTGTPIDSDSILLEWDTKQVDYFKRFFIFWSLTPGIYQAQNSVGTMTVPRIKSSALLAYNTYNQTENAVQLGGFPADTDNYFIIVTQTQQDKYTYSDEIKVTTFP